MKCYLLDQMQEQTEIDKAGEYVILSDNKTGSGMEKSSAFTQMWIPSI